LPLLENLENRLVLSQTLPVLPSSGASGHGVHPALAVNSPKPFKPAHGATVPMVASRQTRPSLFGVAGTKLSSHDPINGVLWFTDQGRLPVKHINGDAIPTHRMGSIHVESATLPIAIVKYGLIHDPIHRQWTGTIKLVNTGSAAFNGPIFVVFSLPAGGMLDNANGTYNGLPYLDLQVGSVAPGAAVSTTVVFNELILPGNYSTSYYLGHLGS
jgi:hypothetical protein